MATVTNSTAATSATLQSLQRQRQWHLKSRNMVANRLQATVAGTLGYHSGMKESDRTKLFQEASKMIDAIAAGEAASDIAGIVLTTVGAITGFDQMRASLEKEMVKLAKTLPVAEWVAKPEQRGFGLTNLAIVIGETGDLNNYANPAKVWRRLGCAPYTFDGKTAMGATWKSGREGKLPAAEWEAFGYSPRRRSIAYNVGEPLLKLNHGPYRARYDEAKARAKETHPDWKDLRAHRHALLLATKLLLKNLWIEWRPAA